MQSTTGGPQGSMDGPLWHRWNATSSGLASSLAPTVPSDQPGFCCFSNLKQQCLRMKPLRHPGTHYSISQTSPPLVSASRHKPRSPGCSSRQSDRRPFHAHRGMVRPGTHQTATRCPRPFHFVRQNTLTRSPQSACPASQSWQQLSRSTFTQALEC